MDLESQVSRVALSCGIGLLIGLERGWSTRQARSGSRAAGVRTFAISGLMGGLAAGLAQGPTGALTLEGSILLGATFIAFAAVIAVFGRDENKAAGRYSATTTVAALLTFILGAYAVLGHASIAAGAAVVTALLLLFREGLHGWVARITRIEFESGLLLLAMTFIALPIVPSGPIGPFGGVNLREIWIIAIALACISFAGYVAVKMLGERRGTLVAAAAGGVVSSTAVAFANARRAAAGEGLPRVLAAGTLLAAAVSFVRVTAIIGVLNPSLVLLAAPTLLVGAAVAAGFAVFATYARGEDGAAQIETTFRNPFGFWSVLGMAVSIGLLVLAGRIVNEKFGAVGAISSAATMGLFDVDAMTVSMARLVPQALNPRTGVYAVLAGVTSNTLVKVVISALIGRRSLAMWVAVPVVGCVLAGAVALILTLQTSA